jgi:hypothetical protein
MDIGEYALCENDILRRMFVAHCFSNGARALDKTLTGDIGSGAVDGSGSEEGADADTRYGVIGNGLDLTAHQDDSAVSGKLAVNFGKVRSCGNGDAENFFEQSFF